MASEREQAVALTPITKDELRERLSILDIVGQYVRLTKAGVEYRGLCPFHGEKTPSFYVNAEKGVWICRGACGVGGDIFDFVQRVENLDFREAAELLAARLGCTLEGGPRESAATDERGRGYEINSLAAQLYEQALWNTANGQQALEYLRGRGLSDDTIREFRLGYAPQSWDALLRRLTAEGVAPRDLATVGLVKARARGDGYYDRFRHRIMFPILDRQGRVLAFGGRVLDPDDEPKYLNGPESPLFSKRKVLYGLHAAARHLRNGAVVVEGYMDVIALHQSGVPSAIATLGTSLTEEHLRLLRRYTEQVVLCYDADVAGKRATDRAAAAFIEGGITGRVLTLPGGQDPDEYVRDQGRDAFDRLLADAPDLIDYRLDEALHGAGEEPGRQSLAMQRAVVSLLGDIADPVRQAHYIRQIAEWWAGRSVGLQEDIERNLRQALSSGGRRRGPRRGAAGEPDDTAPQEAAAPRASAERELLRLLVHKPRLRDEAVRAIAPDGLTQVTCRAVYEALLSAPEMSAAEAVAVLGDGLDGDGRSLLADLVSAEPEPESDLERVVARLRLAQLEERAVALRQQRRALAVDEDEIEAHAPLYRELMSVERQLEELRARLRP